MYGVATNFLAGRDFQFVHALKAVATNSKTTFHAPGLELHVVLLIVTL